MAGTPVPWLAQQFTDNSGVPLSGGKLASYLAGTTTPSPLYTDVGLTVPYPNPLILDSAGRPPGTPAIYMPPTSYKFQLNTSANVLVWVIDNIAAVPPNEIDLDIQQVAGEALAARDVVFVADGTEGGTVAGRWYKADADFANRSTGPRILGIVPLAITSGATGAVRLQGRVTGFSGLTPGAAYYVSAVAGAITAVAPVPPANTRFVGIADTTTTLLLSLGAAANLNPIFNTVQIQDVGPNALQVLGGATIGGIANLNGNIIIANAAPEFDLIETDGVVDGKRWLLQAQSGSLFVRTTEDVPTTFPTVFEVTRSGVTPTGLNLNVPLRLTSDMSISHVAPEFDLIETDGAANAKRWFLQAQSGSLFLRTTEDVPTTFPTVFEVTRSGVTPTAFNLNVVLSLATGLRLTSVISPPQLTADVNDYNPAGLAAASVVRIDASGGDADHVLTGLAAQPAGTVVSIVLLAGKLGLVVESASSSAANRFAFSTSLDFVAPQFPGITLWYDGASSRWRRLG